jgi:hypothetical protein
LTDRQYGLRFASAKKGRLTMASEPLEFDSFNERLNEMVREIAKQDEEIEEIERLLLSLKNIAKGRRL